ncbi:hypothetical protein [Actomonas aquatica]|uniref:DUF4426 domain-containing protein n=1 Tax=Actomonas aquatica TaxID=2866162 RepID=A0ABZ1C4P0_9BACT|nr:hypothetical protein [Opitutus sp. WL0086]WRQ86298.1 hypothetical protein K1X11_015895 [Opitutus sp. WL0086]
MPPRSSMLRCSFALLITLLVVAGCGAPPRSGPPPPQPVITGRAHFFGDQLEVVAELGPFRLVDALPPQRLGGAPVVIDEPALTDRRPRAYAGPGARRGGGAPPRQSLTITLRNTSDEALRLRVAEVRSVLGNFVPVPEIFTLEPGQLQALEPMRASYPAAIDELEVVIRLRTATDSEVQTLKLEL